MHPTETVGWDEDGGIKAGNPDSLKNITHGTCEFHDFRAKLQSGHPAVCVLQHVSIKPEFARYH